MTRVLTRCHGRSTAICSFRLNLCAETAPADAQRASEPMNAPCEVCLGLVLAQASLRFSLDVVFALSLHRARCVCARSIASWVHSARAALQGLPAVAHSFPLVLVLVLLVLVLVLTKQANDRASVYSLEALVSPSRQPAAAAAVADEGRGVRWLIALSVSHSLIRGHRPLAPTCELRRAISTSLVER